MNLLVPLALGVVGAACTLAGLASLRRRTAEERLGSLAAVDAGRPAVLRSMRYRLVGRPDALRRRSDGVLIPVELKHRPAPTRGPFPSHLAQVGAYCLLIEDATGQAPPFGVLRYTDGELALPWDARFRARVVSTLAQATGPYDGRADPSPEKCERCVWSPRCDASLAGRRQPPRRTRRAT
jgi:CRISPR-associated exonuclease Cas4